MRQDEAVGVEKKQQVGGDRRHGKRSEDPRAEIFAENVNAA